MAQRKSSSQAERIPFRMHPRVFAALGSDLVTNDCVAACELVKNSYDALAKRVEVRFLRADSGGMLIEIEDDGVGMTRDIIENVWCVVATPYRVSNPFQQKGKRTRRASGNKGFGRLSCARLGDRLEVITKAQDQPCWEVNVKWPELASGEDLGSCYAAIREYPGKLPFRETGTLLRIAELPHEWEKAKIDELEETLGRLISPFAKVLDFGIWLTRPDKDAKRTRVEPPEFFAHPHYLIKGTVSEDGVLKYGYVFSKGSDRREKSDKQQLGGDGRAERNSGRALNKQPIPCGGFEFEIRVWDISPEDVQEIAEEYNLERARIRRNIRAHKGISLYRDGVLVLPKTDVNRDWLGLDLRRVSRVGMRLSTSQVVGYVSITADENLKLIDTSDRERLVDNEATACFRQALFGIVGILESEREADHIGAEHKEPPFTDLFADLSPQETLDDVNELAKEGAPAAELLPVVENFGRRVEKTRDQLQRRLVYYSRLATIGVLSAMLVHEVRNQTSVIGLLIETLQELLKTGRYDRSRLERQVELAERALRSLDRLADRFAPLASRVLMTRRRDSIFEDIVTDCVTMRERGMKRENITIQYPSSSRTRVAVDPGEMTAIVLNLIDNSVYWLVRSESQDRRIDIQVSRPRDNSRVEVEVSDSGPGVEPGYEERIFWPGVTRKPDGLGMGLTVASEIVAQYGGKMRLVQPGKIGGATFMFDLPISRRLK